MLKFVLERFAEASCPNEVQRLYRDAAHRAGFQTVLYGARYLVQVPEAVFHEAIEVHTNAPGPVVSALKTKGMLMRSPMARWALVNRGDISVRDLLAMQDWTEIDPRTAEPLAALAEADMLTGRLISLKDEVLHSAGAVLLCVPAGTCHDEADRIWSRCHHELGLLTRVMHMRMATIRRSEIPVKLTPRQRQVLGWSAAGKTVGEIATILGLTPATVEKHLRLARETLGVDSTAQAVLRAHLTHQLFPRDVAEDDAW